MLKQLFIIGNPFKSTFGPWKETNQRQQIHWNNNGRSVLLNHISTTQMPLLCLVRSGVRVRVPLMSNPFCVQINVSKRFQSLKSTPVHLKQARVNGNHFSGQLTQFKAFLSTKTLPSTPCIKIYCKHLHWNAKK